MLARFPILVVLLAVCASSNAQEAATYALTPAAAEKFVRATQQMVASGTAPSEQGNGNPFATSPGSALGSCRPPGTDICENAQRSLLE